jgi:hypothetical protein
MSGYQKKRPPKSEVDLEWSTLVAIDGEGKYFLDMATGMVLSRLGSLNRHGYEQVRVRNNKNELSHRVIWETLNGPIPDGLVINHIDSDRSNNRPSNLECVTQLENVQHAIAKGHYKNCREYARGAYSTSSKLSHEQRNELISRYRAGESAVALAMSYSLTHSRVRVILRRELEPHELRDDRGGKPKSPEPEWIPEARQAISSGTSVVEVADRFGVTPATIYARLRSSGTPVKSLKGDKK